MGIGDIEFVASLIWTVIFSFTPKIERKIVETWKKRHKRKSPKKPKAKKRHKRKAKKHRKGKKRRK